MIHIILCCTLFVELLLSLLDDWEQYTERLQQYFIANGISDDSKKLATFWSVGMCSTE